jgi:predicted kinase
VSTLFLTCGLPGSGKTTLARSLEQEYSALRLTADEWLHELHPGVSGARQLHRRRSSSYPDDNARPG